MVSITFEVWGFCTFYTNLKYHHLPQVDDKQIIMKNIFLFISSVAQLCTTLCNPTDHNTPGLPVHHQLLEFTQIHVHWVGDDIQPSHPLSSPFSPAPSIFPSSRDFSSESALRIRWPKSWSFSFNISPSNVYSGVISFRIDWWDLLAIQRTLKSLLQRHNSKASILLHSSFLYSPTLTSIHDHWKNHSLH